MQLWTYHPPSFSIVDHDIDPEKSGYKECSQIQAAYERLWSDPRIGTEQILWCYTESCQVGRTREVKVEWVLDVPEGPGGPILSFVDDIVWNRIIGLKPGIERLYHHWKEMAMQEYPSDMSMQEKHKEMLRQQFWAMSPPTGDWWDVLFKDGPGENVSAIIRHRDPAMCIHSCELYHCSKGPFYQFVDGEMCECNPDQLSPPYSSSSQSS